MQLLNSCTTTSNTSNTNNKKDSIPIKTDIKHKTIDKLKCRDTS